MFDTLWTVQGGAHLLLKVAHLLLKVAHEFHPQAHMPHAYFTSPLHSGIKLRLLRATNLSPPY